VTVDPDGGDYLGNLCGPEEYHVIEDARDLPGALAPLYLVASSAGRAEYSGEFSK
jgi:nitric oxide reductase activation protein